MDERLIHLFDEELRHLRETGREFGRVFPSKAPGLALNQVPADPYVERLLEGVAFLAARVRLRLDSQFPQFTQGLLETVYPDVLSPTPSAAVIRLSPERGSLPPPSGLVVRRGSRVRAVPRRREGQNRVRGEPTPIVFTLAQDVRLLPVELVQADWLVRRVHDCGADADFRARAALRLRLRRTVEAPWKDFQLDPLVIHLPAGRGDDLGFEIYQGLFSLQLGVSLRDGAGAEAKTVFLRRGTGVRRFGFSSETALLPPNPRTFEGYRLLREYFSMPERFLFLSIEGFREALDRCEGDTIEFVVPLREGASDLEREVTASRFALFCSPVVNLFSKPFHQVIEPERFSEFHLVPDANRPLDYEIYSVDGVEGFTESSLRGRRFLPFFRTAHRGGEDGAFFTVNRRSRMLTERERRDGGEVPYPGSEAFLALVDSRQVPYQGDLRQLSIETRCSNRHLPLLLKDDGGDWALEGGVKARVEVVAGPTLPDFQPVDGAYAWRLLGVFSLNYLSLVDPAHGGISALRELLELHSGSRAEWARRQIAALRRVHSSPIVRPLYSESRPGFPPAIAAMVRGLEVVVEYEESAFHDRRLFVLGAVLDEFFAKYVALNSFTETAIRTWPDGREWIRWPARPGLKTQL